MSQDREELANTEITLIHLVVIAGIYSLLVFTCLCMVNYRWRKRKHAIQQIPKSSMPLLKKDDLPKQQRNIIINELFKSNSISIEPTVDLSTTGLGVVKDEDGQVHTIHYKSIIASSPHILEQLLVKKYPKLKRRPSMSLRDFISYLHNHLPHLNFELCSWYCDIYEKSRFSNLEFSQQEYEHFMEQFHVLLQSINKKVQ